MSYQYWIIRFVPDVARGEFSNIGIVCGRDGGDWAVEFDLRSVRSHGGLKSDLRELSGWTSWFRRAVIGGSGSTEAREASSGWVEHLRTRQANSVQFSDPAAVSARSAAEGVDLLFSRLVERAATRRSQGITRRSLRAEVRDVLVDELDLVPGKNLFSGPAFQVGKQRGEFDLLRFEGSTEALTNVWAFNVATLDVLERDIQSWNFLVGRFRDDGATVRLGTETVVELRSDSPIEVVYDPPAPGMESRRADIYEAALEAWTLSGVTPWTWEEFRREKLAV